MIVWGGILNTIECVFLFSLHSLCNYFNDCELHIKWCGWVTEKRKMASKGKAGMESERSWGWLSPPPCGSALLGVAILQVPSRHAALGHLGTWGWILGDAVEDKMVWLVGRKRRTGQMAEVDPAEVILFCAFNFFLMLGVKNQWIKYLKRLG